MTIEISKVDLAEILPLRELYRREMDCQIVHHSLHSRGFTDSYQIRMDDRVAGYGSVLVYPGEPRETVLEFFLLSQHRAHALLLFRRFLAASEARRIRAQTNDRQLTLLLLDCAATIERQNVLFADAGPTRLENPGITFRPLAEAERAVIFRHEVEPVGDWVIEVAGEVAATGGFLLHYNLPYADLYMEVAAPHRRRGYGSYLIQELKRVCYESGRVPAARCDPANTASRATLQKAGMLPCARILSGEIAPDLAD